MQANQQRGQQGRPTVRAEQKYGEDRVREILTEHTEEIKALFATSEKPEAMCVRANALAVAAYRKIQKDADESAASQNKAPQRINEESAVAVCLWAMQRKLDPGTDVYLVPYGGKVSPILSPQGVIKLIMRSGYTKTIQPPRVVFDGEEFDYLLGSEQWVKHKKNNKRPLGKKDGRGQVAANPETWEAMAYVYCIIYLRDSDVPLIEVFDKSDIAYYRSLSPTASSNYSGWAKFPAEFARKAILKQCAKWIPQESEVSVLLAADDTERGIEIPDEFMKAVGARLESGADPKPPAAAQPPVEPTRQSAAAPQRAAEQPKQEPAASRGSDPFAGDPHALLMPGKKGEAPKIADADPADLVKWEGRMRTDLDNGVMDEPDKVRYKANNVRQLATIRKQMRAKELFVEPHAYLDGTPPPAKQPDPEAGELTPEQEEELLAANNGDPADAFGH